MSEDDSLPNGWAVVPLADCTTRITDGTHLPPKFTDEGVPFLFVKHIVGGSMSFEDTKFISRQTYEELHARNRIDNGDILYSAVGSYGVAVPVLTSEPFSFQRHIAHIKPHRELNQRYLVHYLNSQYGLTQAHRAARGVAQKTVTLGDLRRFEVRLAPIQEQARIVTVVEELLSDLDAGVAALERARVNLKKYRAAVLKAAVTGDLTADWRAAHPHVEPATKLLDRILAERRRKWEADHQAKYAASGKSLPNGWQQKYPQPQSPDTNGLPALPHGWCWAGFEQCAFEVTVGHVGPMKDRYVGAGFPFLRSQNVRPLRFDREGLKFIPADFHAQLAKSRLVGGELLVVRSGNIGEACVYPETEPEANCADLVITRLVPGVLPAFAAIFVNSPFGRYLVGGRRTGSALSHFNVGAMESSPFPLPPLREQEEVVAEVERQLSNCAATADYIAASLKRADRLRQSILKEAFAGRLVPQDPADEPASVLLNRIREARASGRQGVTSSTRSRRPRARLTHHGEGSTE